MGRFLRLFSVHFTQIFNLQLIIFAFIGSLILIISVIGYFSPDLGSYYLLDRALMGTGTSIVILTIIPTLLFPTSIVSESESKVIRYYIFRSNTTIYTISKLINSAISGFVIVFLIQTIFLLLLSPFYPLLFVQSSYYAYEELIYGGQVMLGLLLYISHISLSGSIMAVVATCTSTFITNKFICISFPCVFYLFLTRLASNFTLSEIIHPTYLIEGITSGVNPISVFTSKLVVTTVIILILMLISLFKMKGRVFNG